MRLAVPGLAGWVLLACADVRVVDDDGAGGQADIDSAGGMSVGGNGPAPAPATARLFAQWDEPSEDGVQFWNDPDELGIEREPDGRIIIDGAVGFESVGDRLFVLAPPATLYVFDTVWQLESDSQPLDVMDLDATASSSMRGIPELDLLWVQSADPKKGTAFREASQLTGSSPTVAVDWVDPVYDSMRDRLFVIEDGAIRVIENASGNANFEADWTLHEVDGFSARSLVSDGTSLFATGQPQTEFDSHIFAWPLDAQGPTAAADLDGGPAMVALSALPGGGVIGLNDIGVFAWEGASPSYQEQSAQEYISDPELSWRAIAVSSNGGVYIAGDEVWAFDSPALSGPVQKAKGESGLLLLERNL